MIVSRAAFRQTIRDLFELVNPCDHALHCRHPRCREHCCECGIPKRPGR